MVSYVGQAIELLKEMNKRGLQIEEVGCVGPDPAPSATAKCSFLR